MNYEFPRIVHISQVLDAIKGDEDKFLVVDKGDYTVVNYILPCNQTFPAVTNRNMAIRRELRGIKFSNDTGEVMSRPYHKFFNAGEREETLFKNVDITKTNYRLEKLDGSMVHPIRLGGGIRWATKMGVTDTSMQVETWVTGDDKENIIHFCNCMIDAGYTPIFEWCSRKNRIVIDHPVDRLVLTAVRNNITGAYWSYDALLGAGEIYGLEVVEEDTTPIFNFEEYVTNVHDRNDELSEGEVLRFNDGHMIKVKRKDYVNLHKTKDKIQKERNFVAVLLGENLDDLKPFMLEEDLKKAEVYEAQLNINISSLIHVIQDKIERIVENQISRKDFALGSDNIDPLVKQIIFYLWDKNFRVEIIREELMKRLKDACEHEQKFERLKRSVLNGCVW